MSSKVALELTPKQILEYARYFVPQTKDDLWNYIRIIFNMRIPRTACCPGCDAPFDVCWAIYTGEDPEIVVVGARGTGKSVILSVMASVCMLTHNMNVSLMAGSREQAQLIMKYLRDKDTSLEGMLWGSPNAPSFLLDERVDAKDHIRLLPRINPKTGKELPAPVVLAHAASETAIRGHHPHRLLIDEADLAEWENLEHAKGLTQESKTGSKIHTCYSSTYHKYGGTMHRLLTEFKEKEKKLGRKLIYQWCYKEQMVANGGHLSSSFIKTKRMTLSEAQWATEYENKGPQSGLRLFDEADLNFLFDTRFGHILGDMQEWYHYAEVSSMAKNYHGVDWAKQVHNTVLSTLSKNNAGYQLTAWHRTGKLPYPQICANVSNHIKLYRGPVCHDSTGVGLALDDLLVANGLKRRSVLGLNWSKQTLVREAATRYVNAVQEHKIFGPMIDFSFSEHLYLTDEMLRGSDHCPDSVASMIMAYHMAYERSKRTSTPFLRVQI